MRTLLSLLISLSLVPVFSQEDSIASNKEKIPFDGMDLSWLNGQSRVKDPPLVLKDKKGETVLVGTIYMDTYFNYNFADPIDNTQTISSSIGRHKETIINLASIGVESNYKNCIGRLWLQYGAMQHIVQELDGSVHRGRNTGTGNLKYIREATAGYHFNKWHGINVEMGIFMSYIGLESYMLQDNWCYQRSMVCDFTPFYFQGARIQVFPSKKLKQEIWILNGWQTYNSFSKQPGLGSSTYWRPNQNLQLVMNYYAGQDTQDPDTNGYQSDRLRFHHDNSIIGRYYNRPESKAVSQMGISINSHYGFQKGMNASDTITSKQHFMYGTSITNRIWFNKNKIALSLRGDYISNGGNYLAFSPSPVTPNDYTDGFVTEPYKPIEIIQGTITLDIMPNDYFTFRIEYGHREANIPYFTGHGGTTSPSGWTNGPTTQIPWKPSLQKQEDRITLAVNFRL